MGLRSASLVAVAALGLIGGADVDGTTEPTIEALAPTAIEQPTPAPMARIIPEARTARVNLDAVWWTAPSSESVERLAGRWGIKHDDLVALNPTLENGAVEAGERIAVYRMEPDTLSRSIGAPNRGRIQHGAPLVEGDAWVLRAHRPRSWATRSTVNNLAAALVEWRERFPEATPVKIGELSQRGGGRVHPHRSHRSGRDVDIGYVMLEPDVGHRFVPVEVGNFNAAATWGLVRRLLADDRVDSIFMAGYIQAMLLPYAAETLDADEQRAMFSILATDLRSAKKTTIRAWRGHDDHMHVRFACTEADACTQMKNPPRKKKRRKKGKRGKKKR